MILNTDVSLKLQNQEAIFLCKFGCSFCFLEFSLGFLGKDNNFQRQKCLSCRTSLLCIVVTGDRWQVHVTHDTNIKENPTKFGREVEIMLKILSAILPSHFTINIADSAIPTSPRSMLCKILQSLAQNFSGVEEGGGGGVPWDFK